MIQTIFNRKWIFATLLVVPAMGLMLRLGIWQLDRREQRRAFNAHYIEQSTAPPLELTRDTLNADLEDMEYRKIQVAGEYDHPNEVAIRNQSWGDQPGVHLLTPLIISGTDSAVLVDRGWIPLDAYQSGNWEGFNQPGSVTVSGIIRLNQEPTFGGRADPTPQPGESLKAWNFANVETISPQIPYALLPVYLQQSPDSTRTNLPYPDQPEIEISAGPHLSYAIQWFIFATILGVGYPFFVRKQIEREHRAGTA